MSVSLTDDIMRHNNHQVRLFTTVGIYEGRLAVHYHTDATGQTQPWLGMDKLELHHYFMPGEQNLSGPGVVFDPEAVKGIHRVADPADAVDYSRY